MTYVSLGVAAVATIGISVALGTLVGAFGPVMALTQWELAKRGDLGRAQRFMRDRVGRDLGKTIKRGVGVRIIPANDEAGWGLRFAFEGKFVDFHGGEALHVAHLVSPAVNAAGASPSAVKEAVNEIEHSGSPEALFRRVLKWGEDKGWHYTALSEYPESKRLAFEMAAHEESEREAMEGQLQQLEDDWREAEEIASIADNLFLPAAVTDFVERYRPRPL